MNTRSAKNKGRVLQNFVRDMFRYIFKDKLDEGDIESRTMGCNGADIILSPLASKLIPFDIECKNVEKFNINSAMEQCEANTKDNRIPLLIYSRNREDVYISMKLSNLIKLLYPECKDMEIKGKKIIINENSNLNENLVYLFNKNGENNER